MIDDKTTKKIRRTVKSTGFFIDRPTYLFNKNLRVTPKSWVVIG